MFTSRKLLVFVVLLFLICLPTGAQMSRKFTVGGATAVTVGDVVVVVTTADNTVKVTTTVGDANVVGTAVEAGNPASEIAVRLCGGYALTVNVTGTVAAGDVLVTSSTAGRARTATGSESYSGFGFALSDNPSGLGTVSALLVRPNLLYSAVIDLSVNTLQITQATGSNSLIVDTNGLVYDPTNNRVGIGTASPGAPIDVRGPGIVGAAVDIVNAGTALTDVGGLTLSASSPTTNNYVGVLFSDNIGAAAGASGHIGMKLTDRINHYGDISFATRSGAGYTEKMSISAAGVVTFLTDLADSEVSDTLTASKFVGSGSSTDAVDLATAEVSGALAAANVGVLGADNLPTLIHDIAGLAVTDGNFIVMNGTTAVAESGGTARTSLGAYGSGDSPSFANISITGVLKTSTITTFTANDTTPSISAGNIFKIPGTWTAGNNITMFDSAVAGQTIAVIGGDADCNVINGGHLKLESDWNAASGYCLPLVFDGADWWEISARGARAVTSGWTMTSPPAIGGTAPNTGAFTTGTFTASGFPQINVKRPGSSASYAAGIVGSLYNSSSAYVDYGAFGSFIETNTAGSESGYFAVFNRTGGITYAEKFRVTSTGGGIFQGRISTPTITTFTADDTTPSVAAGNIFKVPATWTAGHNVTMLDDGVAGQRAIIMGGDADCTFVQGGHLLIIGNWIAVPTYTLEVIFDGTDWWGLSRTVP